MSTRQCKGCNQELPLEAFDVYDNGTSKGRRHKCRECRRPAQRAACRRYYHRDPERSAARREARKDYARQYYRENRERLIKAAVDWRKANVERARVNEARWRARNPDHFRWHKAARRVGAGLAERDYIRVLLGDPCVYCGGAAEHVDHIDPIALGGSGSWSNLTIACRRCNTVKGANPLLLALLRRTVSDHSGGLGGGSGEGGG